MTRAEAIECALSLERGAVEAYEHDQCRIWIAGTKVGEGPSWLDAVRDMEAHYTEREYAR